MKGMEGKRKEVMAETRGWARENTTGSRAIEDLNNRILGMLKRTGVKQKTETLWHRRMVHR